MSFKINFNKIILSEIFIEMKFFIYLEIRCNFFTISLFKEFDIFIRVSSKDLLNWAKQSLEAISI